MRSLIDGLEFFKSIKIPSESEKLKKQKTMLLVEALILPYDSLPTFILIS